MRKELRHLLKPTNEARSELVYSYRERYFNLYLNSYKWNGVNREEREFIMRKFWETGSVASFRIFDDLVGYASFVPQEFNIYNFPTKVILVNNRGVNYIPQKALYTGVLKLNEARNVEEPEVVLGFAQHSRQPISKIVFNYIDKIVEAEMVIRTNLFAHKLPILYTVDPENEEAFSRLIRDILNDEVAVAVGADDPDKIKPISDKPQYIIDKIYSYIEAEENKLLTFLGIDNSATVKKERLLMDEINANNELINDYRNSVLDNLKEFCELTNKAFGTSLSVESNAPIIESINETTGEETSQPNKEETENEI